MPRTMTQVIVQKCTAGTAMFRGAVRHLQGRKLAQLQMVVPNSHVLKGQRPKPQLSIIMFRWHDYYSDEKHSDYSTTNDGFFHDLLKGANSVDILLEAQYEIFTVFMHDTNDFAKLQPEEIRMRLHSNNVIAWYFVWPMMSEKLNKDSWGFVSERDFFKFTLDMERAGIRTGWPHESTLYRQLCGKLWIPQMSLNKAFRVSPTVRLHYADFARNELRACKTALAQLMKIRKHVWDKEPVDLLDFRGVVKLGFAWGGSDVLPFCGVNSLVTNVRKLLDNPQSSNPYCYVQEIVPDFRGEFRMVCFYDKKRHTFMKEPVWMIALKPEAHHKHKMPAQWDVEEFKLATNQVCSPKDVADRFFDGNEDAQRNAEIEADRVVDMWLQKWYRSESPELPQVTRVDFLVSWNAAMKSRPEVWTCEVGECGASLCGIDEDGRNLAALNTAMVCNEFGDQWPMQQPKFFPRNSLHKA